MTTPVLEVAGAVVAYGERRVLHGVGLAIAQGETVAVLGANGSGKSTLIRAALGLAPLAGGRAELFGTPLGRFRAWHRVGYVPQRLGAGSGVPATVREVVGSGRLARRGFGRPARAADRAAVAAALDAVSLADRAGDRADTLSGGQQQRVLIARALAGEPDLLVLDEPTAGVDLGNQRALADALATFKARGATTVLVAHELGPMAPLIDRAVVMRDGRIAYDGPALDEEDAHGHHHPLAASHDHVPHVGSPLDELGGGR